MVSSPEFLELVSELMAGFGRVSTRRMFSGAGFFRDGRMFALVAADTLFFKSDAHTAAKFDAERLPAFSYATKAGLKTIASFRKAPETCLEDPDIMAEWCRLAWAAALRSDAQKKRKSR